MMFCHFKNPRTRNLSFVLPVFILGIVLLFGNCKKDADEYRRNCGGQLVDNPQFRDAMQVQIDSTLYTSTGESLQRYAISDSVQPEYTVYVIGGSWTIPSVYPAYNTVNVNLLSNNAVNGSTVS